MGKSKKRKAQSSKSLNPASVKTESKVQDPAPSASSALSPLRKALFAGVAVAGFFMVLEVGLALVGVRPIIRDEDPYVGFDSYIPVFVRDDARADPGDIVELKTAANKIDWFNAQRFPERKRAGTFRIFTLGGSTTYGRPFEDPTSFTGWLRAYLNAAAPERAWEVVNAGAISYASYRVANVMEELLAYQPDLFIIYSGNNEFLERRTYGNLLNQPPTLRSANLLLSHSRVYSLMHTLRQRGEDQARKKYELTGEVDEILNRSTGLEAYERDDALRTQILSHYRYNLARMVTMARASGAEVLLVTVPVNEKDFPPFKSQFSDDVAELDRRRIQTLLDEARTALDDGRIVLAREALVEAGDIDPRYADTQYLLGRAWLRAGDHENAEQCFRAAIEEDVCPLRALFPLNVAIQETAERLGVPVVDFRAHLKDLVREESGHRLLGDEFFLDHVHPTVAANGILARSLVDAMSENAMLSVAPDWHQRIGPQVTADIEARADDGAYARAYKNLSKVLIWAGKKAEAEKYTRRAETLLADDWEVQYNAGVVKMEGGDLEGATASFREAIRLNPQAAIAYDYLSAALGEMGALDEAIAYGERAVEIDPSLAIVHSNLAASYIAKGDLARAEASARAAVDVDPGFADGYNNLGNAYFAMGRWDKALAAYEQALELKPTYTYALVNRGLILGQENRIEEAVQSFERAIALDNRLPQAYLGLGKAELSLRRPAEAKASFERVIELDRGLVEGYAWLARAEMAGQRVDAAEQALKRDLAVNPEHPLLLELYGQMLAGQERFTEAIQHLRGAVAASGRYAEPTVDVLHHTLATALLANGQLEEGLQTLERASELNPNNPIVHNDLGLVYENIGQLEKALEHYQRAVAIEPRLSAASEGAERVRAKSGTP